MHQCPNCNAFSISLSRMILSGLAGNFVCPNCHATLRQKLSVKHLTIFLPFIAYWLMQHYFRNAGFVNEVLWLLMATGCAFVIHSQLVEIRVVNKKEFV